MNLDDLKERISTDGRAIWERIQDSGAYNQLRDRYENMTPAMQKLSIYGAIAIIALIILSVPYSNYSQSNESVSEFEGKRMTIRELLKVSREAQEVPNIPAAPALDSLRGTIEGQLKSANLLPEQMKGTDVTQAGGSLIPSNLTQGALLVKLAKLNLRQVSDLGYRLQSISPSVKMKDMTMTANREDSRYFDVTYKLVALAVPAPLEIAPEPPPKGGKAANKKRAKTEE